MYFRSFSVTVDNTFLFKDYVCLLFIRKMFTFQTSFELYSRSIIYTSSHRFIEDQLTFYEGEGEGTTTWKNKSLICMSVFLYIIFTLAIFITFTIKGEGGDGTLSFPPVCSPLIWLWNVMVIPLLQYVHFINYCTLGPQRRKKNHCTKLTVVPTPYAHL